MANLARAFVALAALAFILAVVTSLTGPLLVGPEAYSRAANNLALLALCLFLGFKEGNAA